jgi:hypothetical protein
MEIIAGILVALFLCVLCYGGLVQLFKKDKRNNDDNRR